MADVHSNVLKQMFPGQDYNNARQADFENIGACMRSIGFSRGGYQLSEGNSQGLAISKLERNLEECLGTISIPCLLARQSWMLLSTS